MQHWEDKVSDIEQKIQQLVRLNTHYLQIAQDLQSSNQQLIQENQNLRTQLQEAQQNNTQPQSTQKIEAVENQQVVAPNDTDFAQEKEFIKKQITQYIRDLDSTILWIQSLANHI